MVEIQCPHCEQGIELDDDDSGLFECPFCEREFEWNLESPINYDDSFNIKDFSIGLLGPGLPSALAIVFSLIFMNSWDSLIVFVLSMLIWPVIAIGFLIYGFVKERRFMVFGTFMSLFLMIMFFFFNPIIGFLIY